MKQNDIKKFINIYLKPFFTENGFQVLWVPPASFSVRKNENGIFSEFAFNKFNYAGYIAFQIQVPQLTFFSIEEVFKSIEEKYNFEISGVTFGDYDKSEILQLKRVAIWEIKISNENDFIIFANEAKKYISEIVFPFFAKYNSIASLNEFISNLEVKEILNHIAGSFPVMYFKAMYITYICNNLKKYNIIKTHIFDMIESVKEKENYIDRYPKYMAAYNEFIDELESGRLEKQFAPLSKN